MKILYIRVSKENEEEQSPEHQIPEILHTFKLKEKDVKIYIERVSAYSEEKQNKREVFKEVKSLIEKGLCKEIYVYSLERFERNIKRMLEFYFFCEIHKCKMYSALQYYMNNLLPKNIEKTLENNPIYTFLRYLMILIYSFLAENESWLISVRTKKSFIKTKNSTYSKDGRKVGKKFKSVSGENSLMSYKKENEMFEYICSLITEYEKRKLKNYYPLIKEKVSKKYKIILSSSYLSKIKGGLVNGRS
jgi:DNA invertase Pin-like site-specific DNA recombinase